MGRRSKGREVQVRVGERLRHLRERQALSQAELARRAGTSASQVNAVERGNRAPTVGTLAAFASALRVSPAVFFEDEQPPVRPTPSEKVWYEVVDLLRERDAEYLRAVRELLRGFDRAVRRAAGKK